LAFFWTGLKGLKGSGGVNPGTLRVLCRNPLLDLQCLQGWTVGLRRGKWRVEIGRPGVMDR
jgi:hypothetical protein